MKATAHNNTAERAGRALGRAVRALSRHDRNARSWLITQGLQPGAAQVLSLTAKLVVIGVLFYVAFWLALLAAFALFAAYAGRHADLSDIGKSEWRNGWDGYGLYRGEVRIDCGSVDNE
ncbi:DUF3742 family protein [Chitinimonas koreensis]|uniref:DUF3742 family protein n=1 Tax=Chitinimonas koreensis TaxID=356302 RepID=UPI00048D2CF8|nr:DUF3742 family protein [Chitinimonas koreensis]QNM96698.1 DUF3742 family protein [Chitinimonas koreensis]